MNIKLFGEDKKIHSNSVKNLLNELGVNKETVLVVKNGEIVLEDEEFNQNDDVRVIKVISGG